MAESQYTVALRVQSSSDDAGLVKTEQGLRNVTAAQEEQGSSLGRLATKVGAYLAAWVGIERISGWLREGLEASINQERALAQLSNTAKAFGQDGEAAAKAAKDLAEALARKGFEETQTLQTLATLLPLSKDYKEAVNATTLVSEIAIARNIDYGRALTVVRDLVAGTPRAVSEAHRIFGMQIGSTAQEILNNLVPAMAKEATAMHDTKMAVDAGKASWTDLWKLLGDWVKPVVTWFYETGLKNLINNLKEIPLYIKDIWEKLTIAWNFLSNVDILHPSSFKAALRIYDQEEQAYEQRSLKRWKDLAAGIKKAQEDAVKPLPGAAGHVTAGVKAATEELQQLPALQKRLDAELAARAALPRDPLTGMTEAETKAFWDRIHKINETAEQGIQRKLDSIREETTNRFRRLSAAELQAKLDELRAIVAAGEATEAQLRQMQQLTANITVRLSKQTAEEAISYSLGMFGQNKEVQVAQAIMNTYEGVTKSLAAYPWPWNLIAAAATLAAGLEQVHQIESAEPGSRGGAGMGAGAAAGGGVSMPASVYNPSGVQPQNVSTTNVTTNKPSTVVNNIYAADTMDALVRLEKNRRPGSRMYDRGLPGRAATSIGSRRGA